MDTILIQLYCHNTTKHTVVSNIMQRAKNNEEV